MDAAREEVLSPADPDASSCPGAAADGLPTPRRHWAALTLLTAMSLAVLDATIANVALPTIAADLDTTPASAVWIVNAYNLTVVMLLLPLSAVAERVGFRRMFCIGLTVFLLGSLASALSGSLASLVLARVFQATGSASLMCLFGGLVRNIYPLRMMGRGISWNAMTVGIMTVLGPTIGAGILSLASWQWIFAINLPIGLLAFLGVRMLPDVPGTRKPFDLPSAVLCMVMLACFILGIDHLASHTVRSLGLLAVAAALAVWLVRRALAQPEPLVPVDLLRIPPLAYAVAASALSFAAQMSAFVAFPFYFQQERGLDALTTGLLLSAWPLGAAIMAPPAGRLSDRYSAAMLAGIGAGTMAVGLAVLSALPLDVPLSWTAAAMFLAGVGFGFFQTPNNRAMLTSAPRHRSGAAGGLQATTRVFGQSFGTALVAIAFGLAALRGPTLALAFSSACAVLAVAVNGVRLKRLRP
ncbi:Putative transport protein [plant metagenome]|uniref:Transport protein n=1 Tax=plant metagenome TaxID=1297885 RepID=A0A484U369_9ZZZZ